MNRLRRQVGSLGNLTALEACVRLRSFTAASRELGVSQPAISRRIGELEDRLGIQLFARNGKMITPNRAAIQLQRTLERAFADIKNELNTVLRNSDRIGVSFRITPAASSWLLPVLGDLCKAFPLFPVHIISVDTRGDTSVAPYDLQLKFMEKPKQAEHSELLLEGETLAVASPSLLGKGTRGLGGKPLIQVVNPFSETLDWRTWLGKDLSDHTFIYKESYGECINAAIKGEGVALAWKYAMMQHLNLRLLRQVLKETQMSIFGEYLMISPERVSDPDVQSVAQWLRNHAATIRASMALKA